jgi:hypothetical protein
MNFCPGDQVTVTRNHYPVTGEIELFVPAEAGVVVAVIRVTEDAGLYGQGDLILARVAELEAAP